MATSSNSSATNQRVLTTFELELGSASIGYPILCPGDQPRFKELVLFPDHLCDLNIESDLQDLMVVIDRIFYETGMPIFPCILHHFCLPFSPICAAAYLQRKRHLRTHDSIARWNNSIGRPSGLQVQWNADYYTFFELNPRRWLESPDQGVHRINLGVQTAFGGLRPGLELIMNMPERRAFCLRSSIPFSIDAALGPPDSQSFQPPAEAVINQAPRPSRGALRPESLEVGAAGPMPALDHPSGTPLQTIA